MIASQDNSTREMRFFSSLLNEKLYITHRFDEDGSKRIAKKNSGAFVWYVAGMFLIVDLDILLESQSDHKKQQNQSNAKKETLEPNKKK
jgi:hypothetical protein